MLAQRTRWCYYPDCMIIKYAKITAWTLERTSQNIFGKNLPVHSIFSNFVQVLVENCWWWYSKGQRLCKKTTQKPILEQNVERKSGSKENPEFHPSTIFHLQVL